MSEATRHDYLDHVIYWHGRHLADQAFGYYPESPGKGGLLVWAHLRAGPSTVDDVVKRSGMKRSGVAQALRRLEGYGMVKSSGQRPKTWSVTADTDAKLDGLRVVAQQRIAARRAKRGHAPQQRYDTPARFLG